MGRRERAVGAVVGSAIGDASGAPFEFGPLPGFARTYTADDLHQLAVRLDAEP
jgi:ADP-ribosylglycohydrolase